MPSPLVLAVAAALPAVAAAGPGPRAYVLDRDAPSVTAVSVPDGAVLAQVALTGRPTRLLAVPGGARLLVLDQGPGKDRAAAGYQATGRSALTVLDARSLQVQGRVELGFGLLGGQTPLVLFGPDGRTATVICPGFLGTKPGESLPAELLAIDLEHAAVAARLALDRPPSAALSLAGGEVVVFTPLRAGKGSVPLAAELRFVAAKGARETGRLTLSGDPDAPVLSRDGTLLYLLGSEMLQVVSTAGRRAVAALETGGNPRGLLADEKSGRVFVAGDGAKATGRQAAFGELRVVQGTSEVARLEVVPEPALLRFSPGHERLYVVGRAGISVVDLDRLTVSPIHLEKAGWSIGVAEKAGAASEMVLTADGRRALVLYTSSSKLLVLDLESEEAVASVTTGRAGIRILRLVTAVAETLESQAHGLYTVYNVPAARTALALGPQGRTAYVLNSQTGDLTMVDPSSGRVIDKLGIGGRELALLPGGGGLAVVSSSRLAFLDTAQNRKTGELSLSGLGGVERDEHALAAVGQHEVVFMDAGAVRGRAVGFKRAVQVLFAPAAEAAGQGGL